MRKVLLFDFGCILVGLNKERCIEALKKIGCERIAYYVDECRQEDLFHDLEVGGSIEAFCDEARRQSSYTDEMGVFHPCKASNEEICWAWNELLTGVPAEKLRMVKHLHDDLGYRTAVLSNTNQIHWIKSKADFFTIDGLTVDDYFDEIYLSCDLAMVKPDACIYEEVVHRLGCNGSDILFIDDSAKNCAAAEALGIGVLHDPKGCLWMEKAKEWESWRNGKAAIIGNFDGVHLGHRYVIERLKEISEERSLAPVAVTFDKHPRTLFDPEFTPKFLSTLQEKKDILEKNAGNVIVMPFTKELAQLSAYDFMKLKLHDEMGVKVLLLGYDNRFGKRNSEETFEKYREYGEKLGIEVLLAKPYDVGETRVSSSHVRHLVAEGKMESVAECLGQPYAVSGIVADGYREGRKIGFPTANIIPSQDKLLPPNGVYASQVTIKGCEGAIYKGVTNIGTRPTYNGTELTVETHLIGFSGDLYGKEINVALLRMIRPEQRFDTVEALKEQITKDIEKA